MLGVTWLVVAAVGVLAPVLAHGSSFGSFDVLSQFGVLQQHGVVVHNLQAGDQSDQIIPWSDTCLDAGASWSTAVVESL